VRIANPFVPDLHKSKSSLLLQHSSPVIERHYFVWGAQATLEKTRDRGENDFMRDDMNRGLYGFYLQDQISITDNLKLYAGGRISHHYVTDFNISSSANLVYTFNERHTLRLSGTRVVREPNIYETYMSYAQPSGVSGKVGWYKGNTDLDAEINHAIELGYQFRKPGIKFEAVGFIYDTKDIIEHRHTGNATVNGVFLPVMQFFNMTDTRIVGAEVGGEWSVNDKLKIHIEYLLSIT
jgi:outer membrane receptor for ferrienterochelin and colicin